MKNVGEMKCAESQFTVAFDVKRLADSFRYNWHNYGVTIYTEELYKRLKCTERIAVAPVAFADADEPCLFTLDTFFERMQADLDQNITISWRQWKSLPGILAMLRLLSLIRRGRRLIEPLVRRLDRLMYERTPFPHSPRWDIYHSPINPLPPVQWTGKAMRVLTVHDVFHLKFPELFRRGIPPVRKALDSINVERDYIICVSDCTRSDILSFVPIAEERICVIPEAAKAIFDSPRREKALTLLQSAGVTSGRYVLALAQNDPRKNIMRLAQAFRAVKAQLAFSDYTLVLVVARTTRKSLSARLRASGLQASSFKIVVDIDDETLAGLYSCAALFAFVSLYEGFGLPIVEAMKAGCPVVVSNTSSLPEVAGAAGFYVDPASVEEIAAGLSQVLGSESLRESLRVRGEKQAKAFSWDKTAAMTLDFYERILKTHASDQKADRI